MGWKQGTELDWLQHLVSFWADDFDWRAWSRGLTPSTISHRKAFISCISGRHRAWGCHSSSRTAGPAVSSIIWLCCRCSMASTWSYRPYRDMDSHRAQLRLVSTIATFRSAGTSSCLSSGYSRYGSAGYDFGAGVTTILALDHPESVIGIHLTTLESDLTPTVNDSEPPRPSVRMSR